GSLGAEAAERRRVTSLEYQRRGGDGPRHVPRRPALERRPVAPAVSTGLRFDECPHGHAGHVLERAPEEPRLPVWRGGQQHDRRWGAHLEYEQAGVVAGLFIPHSLQPHLPPPPSGKGKTENRNRESGGHGPPSGGVNYPGAGPPPGA